MGRSAGAGSPVWFKCPKCRASASEVTLTGRARRMRRYRVAVGTRNGNTSHEYTCKCGHTGWSSHNDVTRYATAAPTP